MILNTWRCFLKCLAAEPFHPDWGMCDVIIATDPVIIKRATDGLDVISWELKYALNTCVTTVTATASHFLRLCQCSNDMSYMSIPRLLFWGDKNTGLGFLFDPEVTLAPWLLNNTETHKHHLFWLYKLPVHLVRGYPFNMTTLYLISLLDFSEEQLKYGGVWASPWFSITFTVMPWIAGKTCFSLSPERYLLW